jgi:hypothetical protein
MAEWQVARSVTAHLPTTPVNLLTGWGDQVAQDGDEAECVDGVLGKPVPLRHLLVRIGELSGRPVA